MTEQPRLHHLLDRMRRGVLLPAEAEQLAGLVAELQEEVVNAQQDTEYMKLLVAASSEPGHAVRRVAELAAEVARLTAGQCTHTLAMCQQHHAAPVAGCPYPRCIKAREQQAPPVHLAKGTNAKDCPACRGTNPDYPFLCPGPTGKESTHA